MKFQNIVLSIATLALLTACGSGNSSNDGQKGDKILKKGFVLDSPVVGLKYITKDGYKGFTDNFGRFSYSKEDIVTFYLGGAKNKLLIGKVAPAEDGLVTPDMLTKNDAENIYLLRILQSLDSDKNVDNGIQIPDINKFDQLVSFTDGRSLLDIPEVDLVKELKKVGIVLNEVDGLLGIKDSEALVHADDSKSNLWDTDFLPKQAKTFDDLNEQMYVLANILFDEMQILEKKTKMSEVEKGMYKTLSLLNDNLADLQKEYDKLSFKFKKTIIGAKIFNVLTQINTITTTMENANLDGMDKIRDNLDGVAQKIDKILGL